MQNLSKLQDSLGYKFKNQNLLLESLCHPSLKQSHDAQELPHDYERLEFLGDAVLSLIITEAIFKLFNYHDEGKLAKIRAFLVCKDTLCIVASKLDLAKYIMMTRGEELSGGRTNHNNIENAMEAIIAAIYLDAGLEMTTKIVLHLFEDLLSNKLEVITDSKSALQEWAQGKSMSIPRYDVISQTGRSHSPIFKVVVSIDSLEPEYGYGKSIKAAEKIAAEKLFGRVTC
jgi:ribonuclease III